MISQTQMHYCSNSTCLGSDISLYYLERQGFDDTDELQPGRNHTVLYHIKDKPRNKSPVYRPFERTNNQTDDYKYVRLPNSPKAVIEVPYSGGGTIQKNLWQEFQNSFTNTINSLETLEEAIRQYNTSINHLYALDAYCNQLSDSENNNFFRLVLPGIVSLALKLPELIKSPIPLLKQDQNHSISLSQEQVSCLLANGFLCTFPPWKNQYKTPSINFRGLFENKAPQAVEKIKCIVNYFKRIIDKKPQGIITFTRRSLATSDLPKWSKSDIVLSSTPLHLTSEGTIEDNGKSMLQVDFANKYIGGGVLASGCVQEEIRFIICPELIISRLFTEYLNDNEALIIFGAEQYSKYSGYSSSFKFAENYVDETGFDTQNRRQCQIVAIDAKQFGRYPKPSTTQYEEDSLLRELNKAYVGFYSIYPEPKAVATGNWGCGAFGGDPKLKALIQLMACAMNRRPLLYFTFGDTGLRDEVYAMYVFLLEKRITLGQLYGFLKEFRNKQKSEENIFKFIERIHQSPNNVSKIFGHLLWFLVVPCVVFAPRLFLNATIKVFNFASDRFFSKD